MGTLVQLAKGTRPAGTVIFSPTSAGNQQSKRGHGRFIWPELLKHIQTSIFVTQGLFSLTPALKSMKKPKFVKYIKYLYFIFIITHQKILDLFTTYSSKSFWSWVSSKNCMNFLELESYQISSQTRCKAHQRQQ